MKLTDKFNQNYQELFLEVQMGHVEGASIVWKFGRNEAVGTSEVDIWCAESLYTFPTVAGTLTIESTEVADTQDITIQGLDGDYNEVVETIALTGTTPASGTSSFIRVNRAYNSNGTEHTGNIIIKRDTTVVAHIMAYSQQTLQSIYTVPAGYTGYLFKGNASAGKLKDAQLFFKVRPFGGVFVMAETFGLYQNTYEAVRPFIPITEKADVKVSALSSSAGTDVSAQFGILLLKDELYKY